MKPIQPAHVNEVLRVSAEMSCTTSGDPATCDTEAQMNIITRALILAAIHYNVPREVVVTNFREMYDREPEKVMNELSKSISAGPQ